MPLINLLTVTDTIESQLSGIEAFTYDELNRVTSLTQSGNGVTDKRVDMAYDAASQMTDVVRYSDLEGSQLVAQSNYVYDSAGRLTDLTHAQGSMVLADYEWLYDEANRITQFTSPGGVSDYSYDDDDQLIGTDHSYQTDEAYSYDDNGNRTNDGYQTGVNNQLLSDGTYNYEYDAEGNRTKQTEIATGEVIEYTWDHRNRLTSVITKDSSGNVIEIVEYAYDAFDRRIEKSVDADGDGLGTADVERFVYDGDHIALVFDGDGNQTHRYLHGPQIDQVLAQETADGEVQWALTDNQGTVRDVIDSDGNVLNHISYDSFGNVMAESNPEVDFRFGYTGREIDDETGLYYYRARYYDPSVGQFISEDPIGFEGGDANLYRYVGNSPTNYVDPTGLFVVAAPVIPLAVKGAIVASYVVRETLFDTTEPLSDGTPEEARRLRERNQRTNTPPNNEPSLPVVPEELQDQNPNNCPKKKDEEEGCPEDKGLQYLPVYVEDGDRFPNHVRMVDNAINKHGKPEILTRGPGGKKFGNSNRRKAQAPYRNLMEGYGFVPFEDKLTYDEYPYASTYEGGEKAYIEIVEYDENRDAGSDLKQFYMDNNIKPGCRFRVIVVY